MALGWVDSNTKKYNSVKRVCELCQIHSAPRDIWPEWVERLLSAVTAGSILKPLQDAGGGVIT